MFWGGVLFCIAVPAMANTGMTFHIVSILGEAGITRGPSAFILSMMAVVAFPISFLAGFLLERVPLYKLFAFSFFIETIAVVILIVADSFMMAVLFGLARGIAEGIAILCMAIIIPQYFGRENIGSLKGGAGMTSIVIASSLGPLPFGIAFDTFGGYTQILLVMVLFFSVAAVIAWLNRG
ncbi:hypothetical protein JCM21714_3467 [Gracilibacillus boraciitolerans JCM 21714]|uniref:Major facilitator superfamily (MFS) profile domain-containing protein n=1 Tax=Gracilibacillus boraciitolerans JCM 21714 TaxID=1298598 RepID=W4VLR6_9BACI|nr:MFS transporter [Gracilibacillus boraciitolerans]GAE94320.1 hypothetical protein JCM21714_3467 [Gracilibacillus boraciitolerans JCM 21714]